MKALFIFVVLGGTLLSLYFLQGLWSPQQQAPDTLIVGTNPNFPPFEFIRDGTLVGFDIDLMSEMAKRMGKKIEYKDLAFDVLLLEIGFGRIQAIASGMTPTPERAQRVLFTEPYLEKDPLVIVTLTSQPPVTKVTDLLGKEVIVNDGYTAEAYMDKHHKGVVLKRLASPAEAFLALTSGRAYAYVSARSALQPFFDAYKDTHHFNLYVIDEVYDCYAFAVSKAYPELCNDMNKALNALKADGTLDKLKQKWHLQW